MTTENINKIFKYADDNFKQISDAFKKYGGNINGINEKFNDNMRTSLSEVIMRSDRG